MMKTTIFRVLFVLSISLFPLAISGHNPPLIRLPNQADLVLDTEGNPLVLGAKYYAIPAVIGVQGGISLTTLNTANPSVCPSDVVMNLTIAGTIPPPVLRPISFFPRNLKASASHGRFGDIVEQSPLNVAFYSPDQEDPCAKENVWKLQATIVTGGVKGDESDLSNWFRIHKSSNGRGYIFKWWPSLCSLCKIRNYGIGTIGINDIQLGINDESPYAFEFQKADD